MSFRLRARPYFAFLIGLVLLNIVPGIDGQGCSIGWKKLEGKCLYFGQDSLSYPSAHEACADVGGKLFEPKNGHSNTLIAKVSGNFLNTSEPAYWIGIDDIQQEATFVYNSSGYGLHYQNWAFNNDSGVDEPDNSGGSQDCAAVSNAQGDWIDEDCAMSKQYVCEDLQDDLEYWNACWPGWNLINKKCYKLIDQTVKFDAANEMCKAIGGKLFEPTYESEETMVRAYYYGTEHQVDAIWIGITDQIDEGSFKYTSSGTPVEYTNWAKNSFTDEADNKDNQDCIVLSGGTWRDVDCNCGNVARAVCQQVELEGCSHEPGWHALKGRCFYFGELAKYAEAEEDCIDKGGKLFEPRNAEANALVNQYFRGVMQGAIPLYWIGINALDGAEKYVYASSKDDLAYTQWDTNEPNQANPQTTCVQVQDSKGNWGDFHCKVNRSYVCELPVSYQPYWDKTDLEADKMELVDYIFDTFFETSDCTKPSETDSTTDENGKPRFLTIGGLPYVGKVTNGVYRVDPNTGKSCLHSELPTGGTKEVHVFEFQETLLACSTFTREDTNNLQCWKWHGAFGWENYTTPANNKIFGFIHATKVPGHGIWFSDNKAALTKMLHEDGTWSNEHTWTNPRYRACTVLISPTKVAHIGGTPDKTGRTIDVYDFDTKTEALNVSHMYYERKHHSCALIPKGKDGHPTVAILGDISAPYPYDMELWDTVTNEITLVGHPDGYEEKRFFRPTMDTLGDSSVIIASAHVYDDDGDELLTEMFQYLYGYGWIDLGQSPDPLGLVEQNGIYVLSNPELGEYNSLDKCAY